MLKFNFLTHGEDRKDPIIIPPNIELVKFTYPGKILYIPEVKALFQLIHKRNRLGADDIDHYNTKELRLSPLEENKNLLAPTSIRVSIYKGGETTTNIESSFEDPYSEIVGFYNSEEASIRGPDRHHMGTSGFENNLTKEFIRTVLNGNKQTRHTMRDVLQFLSAKYPGNLVRVFFMSCQEGIYEDLPMTEGNIENIGDETPNMYMPPDINRVYIYNGTKKLIRTELRRPHIIRKAKKRSQKIKHGKGSVKITKAPIVNRKLLRTRNRRNDRSNQYRQKQKKDVHMKNSS
jgi:hypothetical protein